MDKRKKLRLTYNSPVVLTFSLCCLAATCLGIASGGRITSAAFMTYGSALSRLTNPLTWLRLFTHVLGHASWEHFMGNVTYLLLLGPMLEEKYGSACLVKVTAVTALVTGIANYVLFPTVALCGASGVVFAFILLASFTSFREGELPLTFILVVVIFIGQQVADAVLVRDNISNTSHIIGGIVGGVTGYLLNRRSRA